MNTLEQAKKSYLDSQSEIKKVNDRIHQRYAQIERLEKKKSKLWEKSYWTEHLIRPIMDEVKKEFPQIKWDDDRLIPMGLCSRVSLFGYIEDQLVCSICFTPANLSEKAEIHYDTGERKGGYQKGSIGELNGMDKVSEEITDIQQIFDHIEKQLLEIVGK